MNAYVSPRPKVKKKSPAIIWIAGGFPVGGIGDAAWSPQPKLNDQSAKIYREQGLVMMYPSFRGTMGNPGIQEGFYGEVNDVLSALKYLKSLDYVDPNNIYLGGHSTGGTLVLLVAAATSDFKAVFAFGPVAAPIQYGSDYALHDPEDEMENKLRAPALFLNLIQSNTFVIEGSDGNIDALRQLESFNNNPKVKFIEIKKADHFELLFPVNKYIAEKISQPDIGNLVLTEDVLNKAFKDD
jgi:dipeptidyl aminopeptidase/acylaminoacyl peptidase